MNNYQSVLKTINNSLLKSRERSQDIEVILSVEDANTVRELQELHPDWSDEQLLIATASCDGDAKAVADAIGMGADHEMNFFMAVAKLKSRGLNR